MRRYLIPYSGYFSGGEIFMSSEFWASSGKTFCGRCILNHTPVLCDTVSWVKISWFTSQPRKPRKFYPSKNTRYTVYPLSHLLYHPRAKALGQYSKQPQVYIWYSLITQALTYTNHLHNISVLSVCAYSSSGF